jgi:hypothetical protein
METSRKMLSRITVIMVISKIKSNLLRKRESQLQGRVDKGSNISNLLQIKGTTTTLRTQLIH